MDEHGSESSLDGEEHSLDVEICEDDIHHSLAPARARWTSKKASWSMSPGFAWYRPMARLGKFSVSSNSFMV